MNKEMNVNGKSYTIIKLLGKGKGGYSYLAESGNNRYVLKQIHHEPCDYYQFGNKLQVEIRDYKKLKEIGIKMPAMLEADVKNERILNFVDKLVKGIYRNTDKILITSKRFEAPIAAKGDFKEKIIYYPNWSDDVLSMPQEYDIPKLPDGFRIMIAGNLGKSQNLEAVTEVMLGLKDIPEVKWIFVGGGSRKEWLEQFIINNGLM